MEFKKSDYDSCLVNPFSYPLKDELAEVCPAFHYEEFTRDIGNGIKRNAVLRYIVMAYDKSSPLIEKLKDHNKVKAKAAELCGFKKEAKTWSRPVQRIMICENVNVNDMIIRYIRNHHNHKYSFYVALQEEYYRNLKEMVSGRGVDVKKITAVSVELEKVKAELFSGDKSVNLDEKLSALVDFEDLKLRPEDIADRIKANEPTIEAEEI